MQSAGLTKASPTNQNLGSTLPSRFPSFSISRILALAVLLLFASFSRVSAQTFSVLHSFAAGTANGEKPEAGVVLDSSGNMYGTTANGGSTGAGILWEYSPSGAFTILHTFTSTTDGSNPNCPIVINQNNIYGTTFGSGPSTYGTLWEYSSTGTFTVLHSFVSASDGGNPFAGVTFDSSGNMYGTCWQGGANSGGTLWEYSSTGTFSVLHAFTSALDGKTLYRGASFDTSGNLYGTCNAGGANSSGTIWEYSSTGTFSVLYSLTSASDGGSPYAGVTVNSSGNLYGTCETGGAHSGGTLWEISAGGNFTVLHSFTSASDGATPYADVTFDSGGNIYGTCHGGGAYAGGTIWKYSSTGTFSVLYSLQTSGGTTPYAGVTLNSSNTIFGTCEAGGKTSYGTLWKLTQAITLTGVSASSNSFMGGSSCMGTVTLSVPAGLNGLAVSLSSNSRYAVVPPSITVPSGAISASFPIWTDACSSAQSATITAVNGANTFTTNLSLTTYNPYVFNVQIAPTFIAGGTTATGQVQLDHFVTTVGGEVVDLSSSNVVGSGAAYATVPASVTVPFGANNAYFSITTQSVTSVTGVSITATDTGSQSGLIMLLPSGGLGIDLTVNPGGIYGGNSATGTVTLSATQGSATTVSLSSNNSVATVPTSVTIPAGSTSATFTVSTSPVTTIPLPLTGGLTWITCSVGLSSQAFPTAVYPAVVHYVTASPSSVTGGSSSTGTVYLSGTAPTGGITVSLSSSSPDAQVPSSVIVLAGNNSATFNISTSSVVASEKVNISATYNSATASCGLGIGSSVAIHTVTSSPSSVTGGTSSTGTVTFTNPAPTGGAVVTLAASNAVAQVPSSVTVQAGQTSATFAITTSGSNSTVSLSISASLNGKTVSSGFIVGASVSVHYVTIPTSSVTGGTGSTGTVYLNGTAPAGGTVVALSSSNAAAQVPATVTVLAGQSSAIFNITTSAVTSNTALSISVSLNNHSASYGFQVCVPNFIGLTTTGSTTVTGGTSATITANLNGPAPTGGIFITLSSNSTDGSVPARVLIPAGQASVTFTLTTNSVTSTKTITITGTYTQTCHLSFKLTP